MKEKLIQKYLKLIKKVEDINSDLKRTGKYTNEQLVDISTRFALELPEAIFTEEEMNTIRNSEELKNMSIAEENKSRGM